MGYKEYKEYKEYKNQIKLLAVCLLFIAGAAMSGAKSITAEAVENETKEKKVYLTYDDGPSSNTTKLLDILKEEDVKATFFILDGNDVYKRSILRRMTDEGHALGVHSFTHKYSQIYRSVDAFLDDFYTEYNIIRSATGVEPDIFRFPGGSLNSFNKGIYKSLINEMTKRGFVYFDWNVSSDDAIGSSRSQQMRKLTANVGKLDMIVSLMHDAEANKSTPEVTREYIKILKKNGYTFHTLDQNVKPTQFGKY